MSFAGGYNLAGVGAKALAMSGAYRAIADDWSAMYWNPAGLSGQGNEVTLTAKMLYPTVWLTPNAPSEYPGYEGYRNGVEQTTEAKGYLAGAFGLTYRINDKFNAGVSVFAPSALGADWRNLFTGPPYGYNNTEPYPEKSWNSEIKVIDFHPTVAYKVNDDLSLGLGISIQYATLVLESPKKSPSGAPFPFEHFYIDAILEGEGMGFGFNVGALYNLTDDMRIGLSYRGPIDIAIEGNVKQKLILPYSLGLQQAKPEMASLFQGGSLEADPDATADFPLPGDLGLGLAYNATEKLTVAFDVLWTQWSYVDEVTIEIDGLGPTGEPSDNSVLIMHYEDTFRFNFGADMLVNEPTNTHLYVGYYFDPTPIPDESLRPTITDVADKHNISFGFSYSPKDNITLQGYWEHLFSGTRTVEKPGEEDSQIDNLPGDWELQVDTFGLSFSYKF